MANFLDTFSASDGTLLTAHASDSGPGWSGSNALVITDNQVRNTASGGQLCNADGVTVNDDASDSYDIAFVPHFYSNSQNIGITFNKSDDSNFDYVRIGGSSIDLFQVVDGSFNLVRSDSYGSIPGSPQVMSEVKVEVRPTTLRVFYGGTALHTAQAADSNARSGGIGIRGFNSAGTLGWRIDSMSCTNVAFAAAGPSITAADDITAEGQSATFTLSGNTAAPVSATLNGEPVGTLTDQGSGVYSYTAPLIADDDTADLVVSVDGTTASATIAYANSYDRDQLTHPAEQKDYHENSLSYTNAYGTSLAYEWKVVTDANASVVTIDWDALEADDGFHKDVASYATPVANGSTTVTLGVFVPETGQAYQFDRTITVSDGSVEVGGSRIGFKRPVKRSIRASIRESIRS